MKNILRALMYAGLALTLVPSFFYFGGSIEQGTVLTLMTWGTVLYFIGAIPTRPR